MFLVMLLNYLVGLADVYVAGLISASVQAAVGFVAQLLFTVVLIANAVGVGAVAMISRACGSGDRERAVFIARHALFFGLVLATALMLPGLLWPHGIVAAIGVPEALQPLAAQFLTVFSLAIGPNFFLVISNAVFRAFGNVRIPLGTMAVVGVLTIAGDFILTFGAGPIPAMGAVGIAAATAVAMTVGTLLNALILSRKMLARLLPLRVELSGAVIMRLFAVGWPSALLQIAWNAGTLVLFHMLGRLGTDTIASVAAMTNGLRLEAAVFLPAVAMNMAAAVLVGQNLGAGDAGRAEALGWRIASAGGVIVTLLALSVFIAADYYASLIAVDAAVRAETVRYLRLNMLSEPFLALSIILGGGLQGAGDTKGTMKIIVASLWLIRMPLAYVLAFPAGLGALGVWIAMTSSMFVQGTAITVRFRMGAWKRIVLD